MPGKIAMDPLALLLSLVWETKTSEKHILYVLY